MEKYAIQIMAEQIKERESATSGICSRCIWQQLGAGWWCKDTNLVDYGAKLVSTQYYAYEWAYMSDAEY